MVLEIPNLFGNTVDGVIKGSPLNGIMASPYGISLIIVLTIIFIYYLSCHDEMGTKDIIGSFIYMMLAVIGLIYIHDHAISENPLTSPEVKKILPVTGAGNNNLNNDVDKTEMNNRLLNEIKGALGGNKQKLNIMPSTSQQPQVSQNDDDDGDESVDDDDVTDTTQIGGNSEYFV